MTSFQILSELNIHESAGDPYEYIDQVNEELPSDRFRILTYYDGKVSEYYLVTVEE